jgi:hypothetical protein
MIRLDVLDLTNRERFTRNSVPLSFSFSRRYMNEQGIIPDDVASIAPSQIAVKSNQISRHVI